MMLATTASGFAMAAAFLVVAGDSDVSAVSVKLERARVVVATTPADTDFGSKYTTSWIGNTYGGGACNSTFGEGRVKTPPLPPTLQQACSQPAPLLAPTHEPLARR